MKITEDEMIELCESEEIDSKWTGDNLFQGCLILAKYIDPVKHDIIQGASHDVVWGPDLSKLEEVGITRDDFVELLKLNWHHDEDNECIACFV